MWFDWEIYGIIHARFWNLVNRNSHILYKVLVFYCFRHLKTKEIWLFGLMIGQEPFSSNLYHISRLDLPFTKLFQPFAWFGGHSGAKAAVDWKKNCIFDYFIRIKPNKCAQKKHLDASFKPVCIVWSNTMGILIIIWGLWDSKSKSQCVKWPGNRTFSSFFSVKHLKINQWVLITKCIW